MIEMGGIHGIILGQEKTESDLCCLLYTSDAADE